MLRKFFIRMLENRHPRQIFSNLITDDPTKTITPTDKNNGTPIRGIKSTPKVKFSLDEIICQKGSMFVTCFCNFFPRNL